MEEQEYDDDVHPFVRKFYDTLWQLLKVLMILAFLAIILFGRYLFDKWYVNWLMNN